MSRRISRWWAKRLDLRWDRSDSGSTATKPGHAEARPWIDYLARTSFMLQQGHFGADLIYFYGEDSNLTAIFANKSPDVPAGYGFDYVNADALIHELTAANGRITTKSGMSYRVLGLDPYSGHMSLPVLRAIHQAGGRRCGCCWAQAERRSEPFRRPGGVSQIE
jgi:hypothetical protein